MCRCTITAVLMLGHLLALGGCLLYYEGNVVYDVDLVGIIKNVVIKFERGDFLNVCCDNDAI